ncbi:hypothetical protein AB0D12_05730 [Streptomyces sp. NPDC048479]|uniref:hypothetical protein n=1 Tax=Streptomyces sp. NPDC048479 TaxID=3154725 RepID=UPI0034188022
MAEPFECGARRPLSPARTVKVKGDFASPASMGGRDRETLGRNAEHAFSLLTRSAPV